MTRTRAALRGSPPAVLVGHSAGAEIAMHVAVEDRAAVVGLVLIAPVTGSGPPSAVRLLARVPGSARIGGPVLRAGRRFFPQAFALAWADRSRLTPEVVEGYRRPLLAPGAAEAIWAMTATAPTPPPRLPPDLPTLVITGAHDRWTTPVQGGLVTTRQLAGCGHLPHEEQPDEVAAAIRAFVADHPERDRPKLGA